MSDGGVFISGSFLRYWRATAVSGLGTYVTVFALQALVVLTLDGTAADVGWLNAARWLPHLTFGLVVGALVDGRRRLPLMVRTEVIGDNEVAAAKDEGSVIGFVLFGPNKDDTAVGEVFALYVRPDRWGVWSSPTPLAPRD